MLHNLSNPVVIAQCMTSLFLAILFLQSGLDKVLNFKGNLSWLEGHFSKTFLKGAVPVLLATLTVTEVLAGALSLLGAAQIFIFNQKTFALYGAELSALSIVMLFFGQRIAQDYAGAASLVPYFLVSIGAILLLGFA
jgi:putative oxidoreductase